MTETYYKRLGISPDADQSEIKRAWREAVKETHPDHNDDPNAQQQFIQIKEAYDVLSDPQQRERYDEMGHDHFVSDRQRTTSQESQEAYQRDRAQRTTTDSKQDRSAKVDWSANTRGHQAAEYVWKPGSGPTADTAPPTGTADASYAKRTVAYSALTIIPAMLSVFLVASWTGGIPEWGVEGGVNAAAFAITALTVGILYLLITGTEWLLDTDRRLWRPF